MKLLFLHLHLPLHLPLHVVVTFARLLLSLESLPGAEVACFFPVIYTI